MKKYAATKPSGVEWLGEVPAHWEVKRLKFISNGVKTGGTPPSVGTDYFDETGVNWYNPGDFGALRLGEARKKLLPEAFSDGVCKLFPAGSVLIVGIGATLGKIGLATEPSGSNQQINAIMPTEEVVPDYLAYYLTAAGQEIISTSSASTLGILNQEKTKQITCALPPLPEQRVIAAFLDERMTHLDGLIRRKEDLLKLLAEQRSALITRAVTRGLDAAAPLRDSGVPWLGQVPAHWEVKRLKFVANIHSGIAKGKKYLPNQELIEVPYLRVANVQDGYLNLEEISSISVTPEEAEKYELLPMDILMNEGGDNDKLGRGTVWEGQITPCIHQNHVFAIRHNGTVDSWFLSYFFGSNACKPYFFLSGNQATNLASISSSAIADTPFPMPPLTEQREIVKAVDKGNKRLDKMTDITNREISRLREYRAALITAAVTGRIDVRTAVVPTPKPALTDAL